MTPASSNANVEMRVFPIRLQAGGQIAVPQVLQEKLNLTEGDMLTLLEVGEVLLLATKPPQVPQLADRILAIMESEGVSLSDLLLGLETERENISQEQQSNA